MFPNFSNGYSSRYTYLLVMYVRLTVMMMTVMMMTTMMMMPNDDDDDTYQLFNQTTVNFLLV